MMVIERMDSPLDTALNHPDCQKILALAVGHADITIRKYVWRGLRPTFRSDQEILAGDKSASDFVQEAIKRLRGGQRAFDASKTLLENINSITDSLIWSEKKSSDRTGIVDYADWQWDRPGERVLADLRTLAERRMHADRDLYEQLVRGIVDVHPVRDAVDGLEAKRVVRAPEGELLRERHRLPPFYH